MLRESETAGDAIFTISLCGRLRSPAVVTELLPHRDIYVYVLPLGRQKVLNRSPSKSFLRCSRDVLTNIDALPVTRTLPVGVKGALPSQVLACAAVFS